MSEHPSNDSLPTRDAPALVDVSAQALASARRRSFLKIGSGVVPVALTLSSRPVMATQCLTASAWGSYQGMSVNNSQYTRLQNKSVTLTGTYTLGTWCGYSGVDAKTGTPTCSGWASATLGCTTADKVKAYTVGTLCSGVTTPSGLVSNDKVWDVLTGKNPSTGVAYSSFQKSMVCAWLNYKVQTGTTVSKCVTDTTRGVNQLNVLSGISSAGGTGPDGKQWTQDRVITYLYSNWLAR